MAVRWLELDGAANVRDLAGLPTIDGREVQPGRLIRSANLQSLSERDVATLVGEHNVRSVADLRTDVEVRVEGPGPLTAVDDVDIRNLSLYPDDDDPEPDGDAPVLLPWQDERRAVAREEARQRNGAAGVYQLYLDNRADSVLAALRLIACSPGATIVNCAAGKDRTGVIVAFALAEVGVTPDAIVADYARSAERILDIFASLRGLRTYAKEMEHADADRQAPKAETMQALLDYLDAEHGGASGWLRAHGWTDADAAALRAKLLDP